jgi:cell wall-associated NlpC family hydrolase/LysM repeat protein
LRSKIYTLGACLVLAGIALAQTKTPVQQGDEDRTANGRAEAPTAESPSTQNTSDSQINFYGTVFHVPVAAPNVDHYKNSLGDLPEMAAPGVMIYEVRNGDVGGSIARKFNTTTKKIEELNPGLNWNRLQIGMKIKVPAPAGRANADSQSKATPSGQTYTVRAGDNDWIIASRLGTTPSKLRQTNANVDWPNLQIGTVLQVPSGAGALAEKPIRSRHAKVAADSAVVRRAPNANAEKVTVVQSGTQVTVLDHESGWYKLKFPKGTVGWMRGDLLREIAAPAVANARPQQAQTRTAARPQNNRVAQAPRAATRTASNRPAQAARPAQSAPRQSFIPGAGVVSNLLATAQSYRGVRYRWGGTTAKGFDCSGFVSTVYRQHGVSLPRTSRSMASTAGTPVSLKDLKPGDLVFFKTRRSSRINHVGIYQGDGKFIHSSSGQGGVRVDRLDSGYYSKTVVSARRVSQKLPEVEALKAEAAKSAKAAEKPQVEMAEQSLDTVKTANSGQAAPPAGEQQKLQDPPPAAERATENRGTTQNNDQKNDQKTDQNEG